jgi:hypothetical protein
MPDRLKIMIVDDILHSASTRAELEDLAQGCGAAGIIEKAPDPSEFIQQFEQLVANNRRARETSRQR